MVVIGLARHRVPELMDDPSIAPGVHQAALRGLHTINRLSLTARELLPHVLSLARDLGKSELRLLDVACGGGDVPIELARLCAQHGIRIELVLADRSETALANAHAVAAQAALESATRTDNAASGATTCAYIHCDALSPELPEADIVTNCLFLHHLDPPEVKAVLHHLASRARHLLLISDLRRSSVGLAVAWTTCHLLSRSHIVRHDGPASVRAAYTMKELREIAASAGLAEVDIRRCWPWRILLSWRRVP